MSAWTASAVLTFGAALGMAGEPINLYYSGRPSPDGRYFYDFSLRVDEPLGSWTMLDWIIFFDAEKRPSPVNGLELRSDPPPPFTRLSWSTGYHNGPMWLNFPFAGWEPEGRGDELRWSVRVDEPVDEAVLWSNLVGTDFYGLFSPAIEVAAPSLEITGPCPGEIRVRIDGATPNARVAVLYGFGVKLNSIPDGFLCGGTPIDLREPIALERIVMTDALGTAEYERFIIADACSRVLVQAIDVSRCVVSNAELL